MARCFRCKCIHVGRSRSRIVPALCSTAASALAIPCLGKIALCAVSNLVFFCRFVLNLTATALAHPAPLEYHVLLKSFAIKYVFYRCHWRASSFYFSFKRAHVRSCLLSCGCLHSFLLLYYVDRQYVSFYFANRRQCLHSLLHFSYRAITPSLHYRLLLLFGFLLSKEKKT